MQRLKGGRWAHRVTRKLRIEFAGACYHVTKRGNYRRDRFAAGGAARSFLCCLDQACTRYGWLVHAFVIMRNHFHLAVDTPEPNLSDGMKWRQRTWAMRFNRFRRETGRPFQGRYKAGWRSGCRWGRPAASPRCSLAFARAAGGFWRKIPDSGRDPVIAPQGWGTTGSNPVSYQSPTSRRRRWFLAGAIPPAPRLSAGYSAAKARKLLWRDTGLAAWLAGVRAADVRDRADAGFWLEQVVFQTLQSWAALDPQRRVHYWREGDVEIDFVLEQAGALVGMEVKAAKKIGPEDLRGVRAWQAAFTRKGDVPRAVVLHGGEEARFLGDNAWALGLGALLPA